MVACAFDLSTWEAEAELYEFKARLVYYEFKVSLIYIESSRSDNETINKETKK